MGKFPTYHFTWIDSRRTAHDPTRRRTIMTNDSQSVLELAAMLVVAALTLTSLALSVQGLLLR
jgi:hypothetical protein